MQDLLHKVVAGGHLTEAEMVRAMTSIMEGEVSPTVIGSFLTALRMKGETVDELVGAVRVMRDKSEKIAIPDGPSVDTCGTGGDGADTFNISTTAAFVVAGAGVCVAKHGNRAVSSRSGSADVLRCLGVNIEAGPAVVERCLKEAGIGFLYAPAFHTAMKHAAATRRELGFRTLFNLLGPLTNPAGVQSQVIGVFTGRWLTTLAKVLQRLECHHAFIVHGEDGLDEITLTGNSKVCELTYGEIKEYNFNPEEFSMSCCDPKDLQGGGPEDNARLTLAILEGAKGPSRDVVLLNSAVALVASGAASAFKQGLDLARESIDTGAAGDKLRALCKISQQ